jgi:hypothetical protein
VSTIVSLSSVQVQANLVRLDVLIKDAPLDLFGVAFHVKVKGGGWEVSKWEVGDVFPLAVQPLTLVSTQKDTSEIVAGLSLKRGYKAASQEGKLLSFYLETSGQEPLSFEFTDGVVSAFQAQRRDLADVIWQNNVTGPFNMVEEAHAAVLAVPEYDLHIDGYSLIAVYMVIFGAFLVAVFVMFVYLAFTKKKKYR